MLWEVKVEKRLEITKKKLDEFGISQEKVGGDTDAPFLHTQPTLNVYRR